MEAPAGTNVLSCKVVLLGETGVGKTSIIARYINNSFDINNMTTTGASFAAKTMNFEKFDKNLKFEIWDTAGQEKYRSLTKIFYKDASVAIIVYDITRKQSYEEIKNYWINQLHEFGSKKLIIAIAANKADLYDSEEVSEVESREYAKEIGAIYRQTSAKNATGVEELFKAIGLKFLDPNCEVDAETEKEEKEKEKLRRETVKIKKQDEVKSEPKQGCNC